MKRIVTRIFLLSCLLLPLLLSSASAAFTFSDDRFAGDFSTENLDRIIEEYELHPGWFWTTEAGVPQTFHGVEDAPGWTDTAVNKNNYTEYLKGRYGCRWGIDDVWYLAPGRGGYGECFGFAQFVGYLLSGDYNPHKNWDFFYHLEDAGGLQVGDILRTEFKAGGKVYRHSAVVYSVSEDEILFLQVSGGYYNKIYLSGFSDGYHLDLRKLEDLEKIRNKKICRSPLSLASPAEEENPA